MERRKLLKSLPALGATYGITSGNVAANQGENNTGKKYHRIVDSISGLNFQSDMISPSLDVVQEGMNKEQTALVNIQLENVSNEQININWTAPNKVNALFGTRDRGNHSAILIGKLNTWKTDYTELWKAKQKDVNGDLPDKELSVSLAPSATFNNQLQLWAGPGRNNNLPPGQYVFDRSYMVDGEESDLEFSMSVNN